MRGRLVGWGLWLLAAVLVTALTHLIAILILPRLAPRDAAHRLAPLLASDHMTLLPPAGPASMLIPFGDAAVVQSACFFDLTASPARIRASVEEGKLLTLSFRTREGQIFYAMTDRAALHGSIDIRLVSDEQLQAVEAGDDEDQGLPTELRLKAPSQRGMVVATALVARPAERQDAESRVKAVECHPEIVGTVAR